jgi:hypothetical protein
MRRSRRRPPSLLGGDRSEWVVSLAELWDFPSYFLGNEWDDGYSTNESHAKGTLRVTLPSSKNRSATSTGPASVSVT